MGDKNAIQLLTADHRTVEALFEDFKGAKSSATKARTVRQICKELTVHMMIEEEIFYPGVTLAVEEDLMKEAYVEHDGAKQIVIDLLTGAPSDAFFDAKVSVPKEMIEHHVYEKSASATVCSRKRARTMSISMRSAKLCSRERPS